MDISGVALAAARERACARGVEINWIETDLERPDVARDAYDVIVVARFLDRPLIPRLIDALRLGGHVVYDHHYLTPADVGGPKSHRFRARPNELLERFRALRVPVLRGGDRRRPRRKPHGSREARRLQGFAGVLNPGTLSPRLPLPVCFVTFGAEVELRGQQFPLSPETSIESPQPDAQTVEMAAKFR